MNRVASLAALAALAGSAAADVITTTAENRSQNDPIGVAFSGTTWIGQSFTALTSGRVTNVDFALTRSAQAAGSLTVEVWAIRGADEFPSPDNDDANRIASTEVSYAGLSDDPTFITAAFAVDEAKGIFAGRTYAMVFRSSESVRLWVGRGEAYTEGGFFQWTTSFGIGAPDGLDAYFAVDVPAPAGAAALAAAGLFAAGRRRR